VTEARPAQKRSNYRILNVECRTAEVQTPAGMAAPGSSGHIFHRNWMLIIPGKEGSDYSEPSYFPARSSFLKSGSSFEIRYSLFDILRFAFVEFIRKRFFD
jgi:hypothetical protein